MDNNIIIPVITMQRAETSLELGDSKSFVIMVTLHLVKTPSNGMEVPPAGG